MRGLPTRSLLGAIASSSRASVQCEEVAQRIAACQVPGLRFASASALPEHIDPPQVHEHDTFRASDIEYHLTTPRPRTNLEDVKFGTVFTDHMLVTEHVDGQGWSRPQVGPFGYLQLHPASQVLHYGMACFEGMKAYRGQDGRPRLFRPEMNTARLLRSAQRLQLAPFDPTELLECIKSLVRVDSTWLPSMEGHSLYIRPFMFSSAHVLGVSKATRATMSIVMSPVGPYFPSGMRPVSLFVEERYVRAWPGGTGDCKVGGNYAPTIQPQTEAAAAHGTQQVVYTFHPSRGMVVDDTLDKASSDAEEAHFEECGAMNIFFVLEKKGGGGLELATPDLRQGTILPGVTRQSIIELSKSWGEFSVSERRITLREVKEAAAEGRLREVFGSGTACVVQPVSALVRSDGQVWTPRVTDPSSPQALAPRLQRALLDIQYGRVADHPWSVPVDSL